MAMSKPSQLLGSPSGSSSGKGPQKALPLRWDPSSIGSGFRLTDADLSVQALSSYLQTAIGTLCISNGNSSETNGNHSNGAIHEWRFAIEKVAVCTWIGVVPPGADVYSFMGRDESAVAYSSAGTLLQGSKIATKPDALKFTSGDIVAVKVNVATSPRTMTILVNGVVAHKFLGISKVCYLNATSGDQ